MIEIIGETNDGFYLCRVEKSLLERLNVGGPTNMKPGAKLNVDPLVMAVRGEVGAITETFEGMEDRIADLTRKLDELPAKVGEELAAVLEKLSLIDEDVTGILSRPMGRCPHCWSTLAMTTDRINGQQAEPAHGDLGVCVYCGVGLRCDRGRMRTLSESEFAELDDETRAELHEARVQILLRPGRVRTID